MRRWFLSLFLPSFCISSSAKSLALLGILYLAIFLPTSLNASSLQRARFTHFGAEHGLPSDAIFSLFQDSQGLVWLGTSSGLVRYNGRKIKTFAYDANDKNTLSNNLILSMYEDDKKNLWVGTRTGLDRLNLRTDEIERGTVPASLPLQGRNVTGIAPGNFGKLWIGFQGGVHLFDPSNGRYSEWKPAEGEKWKNGRVLKLISDGALGVWFSIGSEIFHVNYLGKLVHRANLSEGIGAEKKLASDLHVRSMCIDSQKRLWVGMVDGLQIWSIANNQYKPDHVIKHVQIPKGRVDAILLDKDNSMWIAQSGSVGLSHWREGAVGVERFVSMLGVSNSLSSNSVLSLLLDKNATLWVGTLDRGVSLMDVDGQTFSAYLKVLDEPNSLSFPVVGAVAGGIGDYVWVGTYGDGLNRVDMRTGAVDHIDKKKVPLLQIKFLLPDGNDYLWVAGDGGLLRFNHRLGISQTINLGASDLRSNSISSVVKDRSGYVWAGSAHGLYQVDPNLKVKTFLADPKADGALKHDIIDCLLEDSQGNLWFGSKGGLFRWNSLNATFEQPVQASKDMPAPDKLAIHGLRQDFRGRIWVATEAGLFELIEQSSVWTLKAWNLIEGMPKGGFDSVQDAKNGEIWLGSEQGVTRFDPKELRAHFYSGVSHFGGGMSFGATHRAADGSILFGGNGLFRFQPELMKANRIAPRVILSDILIFNHSLIDTNNEASDAEKSDREKVKSPTLKDIGIDENLHHARSIRLSHRETMVSFELSALQFYNNTQNRYAWKLEGYNQDWINGVGDQSTATYTNLDPGHYRLLAKAANPEGVWGETTQLLDIEFEPPFWRTWWWYTGLVLFFIGILFVAYRIRVKTLKENQKYLEEEVKNQTKEVLEQKAAAEEQRESAEKSRRDIALLSEIGQQITASLDVLAIEQALYLHMKELVNVTTFCIHFLSEDAQTLVSDFVIELDVAAPKVDYPIDHPTSHTAHCARKKQEIFIELSRDEVNQNLVPGTVNTLSLLFAPLQSGERLIGVMSIQSEHEKIYGNREKLIFRTLCAYGAIAFDNASAYRQLKHTLKNLSEAQTRLEESSLTDHLTGLRNRRFLMQHIENDILLLVRRHENYLRGNAGSAALSNDTDIIFFMVDLDHFKSVNDLYGHSSGDMVLMQIKHRLATVLRESDYVIRWGGEEFLLVARGTNRANAVVIAERIRVAIESVDFEVSNGVMLSKTCSIGFASFPFVSQTPRLLSWEQVVELADRGLYMAKNGGRNAWVGLEATNNTRSQALFERITSSTLPLIESGEILCLTSFPSNRAEKQ